MVTELIYAVSIIALGGLILWGLLFKILGARTGSPEEPPKEPIQGSMLWFRDCYEPCMRDPEQSSDTCVMMCAWNLM
jgi:hypothetical protein